MSKSTNKTKVEIKKDDAQKIKKVFAPINTTDRSIKSNALTKASKLKRHRYNLKRVVLSIGFVLLITAAGAFLFNQFAGQNGDGTSNQIKSVLSGEELKDYTSPENKFTILMPGIPKITSTTVKSGDKDIPITSYIRVVDNNSKNYSLAVYDYTGVQLDESKALESALNSALQKTVGATVVSTTAGKYHDLNAIEGVYNVNDQGKTYEAHIRYIIKGPRMYAVILIGGDQAKFDEFANSLRLN